MVISRRQLLQRTGALGLGMVFVGSLDAVFGDAAHRPLPAGDVHGYGPLVPDPAGVLDLPQGFSYRTFSHSGQDAPGGVVPDRHDGMCTFERGASTRLVRNHEASTDDVRVPAPPERTYDEPASGGTMTLEVDRHLELLAHWGSLGGTVRNCAGGRTPWRTWLSCEETEVRAGEPGRDEVPYARDHGWVFEVDPVDEANNVDPTPLTAMGRFSHEAVAVDPHTRVAYLTEDAAGPYGLFYRFLPRDASGGYGSYRAGGRLEALRVPGLADLSTVRRPGTRLCPVEWVPVPDPLAASTSVRSQLEDDQVTRSQKLEGAWYAHGSVYFAASFSTTVDGTDGRVAHDGQVWRYAPREGTLTLELIFTGDTRFGRPDNITISPFGGGVVLAEDGSDDEQYLVGVARDRRPFPIARNALNSSELAGVSFDRDHRTLFGNIYGGGGGRTFAVRGPWHRSGPAG